MNDRIEIDLDKIESAAKAATTGEWERKTVHNDGDYGSGPDCRSGFVSYAIFVGDKELFNTIDSDAAEVHEDYDEDGVIAWNEVGLRNMHFVVTASPAVVLELVRRLREAEKDAKRYRWLVDNSFDREPPQMHCWWHTWEPHSVSGELTEWKQRVRGPAIDRVIDAAMGEPK